MKIHQKWLMYWTNLILNRREKPLEESHETGVGEGRELYTQESTSQELLAKSAGRDFSIQSAKVKTEHSASPSSGLELIKPLFKAAAGWSPALGQVGLLGNNEAAQCRGYSNHEEFRTQNQLESQ